MLCLNVLSLGYFSLHEQREVTRSPDASGNPQDATKEKNEITAVPPSPAIGRGGRLNFSAHQVAKPRGR
jgi:hypothetical protein